MKIMPAFLSAVMLAGCNAVNIKPNSLDKTQTFYADRGGYTMKFAVKQALEERGYKVVVGKAKNTIGGDETFELTTTDTGNARYIVKAQEKDPRFAPVLCVFNGFYWWRFNVSVADQKTGEELLAWTGRGCANSSLRRLNRLMDKLEKNPS